MNKTFQKQSTISLDSSHHLTSDGDNGIILTFHEIREREKLETKNGKKVKSGKTEEYLYEGKLYFTRIVSALKYFVDKTQNESKTLEELIAKVDYNTKLLERLDREFKQFD